MSDQEQENANMEQEGQEARGSQDPGGGNSAHEEELKCVACGHPIEQDDLVCPNCGISLVAG
jgi:rubrerythrin